MSQSDSSVQNITSTEDDEGDDDQPLDSVLKGFHELLTNVDFWSKTGNVSKIESFQKLDFY